MEFFHLMEIYCEMFNYKDLRLEVMCIAANLKFDVYLFQIMESFQESGKTPTFMESLIIFVSGVMKDCEF